MEWVITDLSDFINNNFVFVYPILLVLIVVEFFSARHLYHIKESLSGFGIALVASLIAAFTKVVALAIFVFCFSYFEPLRVEYLGYSSFGWAWYVWILCILADDFNFYWHHRLSHNIRLLWAAHVPHHSSMTFNLTVSIRNGWFITFYKPVFWLWMAVVGFEPLMIATCLIINANYQFFLHSQLVPSLGWFGKIFNTPYIHQLHHSSNVEYLDKNHGGIFLIWDKLFGTFQDVIPDVAPKFGVIHGPKNFSPVEANIHEFRSIVEDTRKSKNLWHRLKYIFYPPGWSHDGSSLTTRQIQKELATAKLEKRNAVIGTVKAI